MNTHKTLQTIGLIEIILGSAALLGNFFLLALSLNAKTPNVLVFVTITGILSTLIGIGILKFNKTAYDLLLYFSSIVVLSKILIFLNIIELNGQLEISVHKALSVPLSEALKNFMISLKNAVSVLYHSFVIIYLNKPDVKKIFIS